jgi:hypothetical protein
MKLNVEPNVDLVISENKQQDIYALAWSYMDSINVTDRRIRCLTRNLSRLHSKLHENKVVFYSNINYDDILFIDQIPMDVRCFDDKKNIIVEP